MIDLISNGLNLRTRLKISLESFPQAIRNESAHDIRYLSKDSAKSAGSATIIIYNQKSNLYEEFKNDPIADPAGSADLQTQQAQYNAGSLRNYCGLNVKFIQECCGGLPVTSQQVIDNLLSVEDEMNICNGEISYESLRLHIQLWLESGMPYYSGK